MGKQGEGEHDRLLQLFQRLDRNGDGSIDEAEFGELMEKLGWDSPLEVRALEFAAVDANSDGQIDFQEFTDWWLDQN